MNTFIVLFIHVNLNLAVENTQRFDGGKSHLDVWQNRLKFFPQEYFLSLDDLPDSERLEETMLYALPKAERLEEYRRQDLLQDDQLKEYHRQDLPQDNQPTEYQQQDHPKDNKQKEYNQQDLPQNDQPKKYHHQDHPKYNQLKEHHRQDLPKDDQLKEYHQQDLPLDNQLKEHHRQDLPQDDQLKEYQRQDLPQDDQLKEYRRQDLPQDDQLKEYQRQDLPQNEHSQEHNRQDLPQDDQLKEYHRQDLPEDNQQKAYHHQDLPLDDRQEEISLDVEQQGGGPAVDPESDRQQQEHAAEAEQGRVNLPEADRLLEARIVDDVNLAGLNNLKSFGYNDDIQADRVEESKTVVEMNNLNPKDGASILQVNQQAKQNKGDLGVPQGPVVVPAVPQGGSFPLGAFNGETLGESANVFPPIVTKKEDDKRRRETKIELPGPSLLPNNAEGEHVMKEDTNTDDFNLFLKTPERPYNAGPDYAQFMDQTFRTLQTQLALKQLRGKGAKEKVDIQELVRASKFDFNPKTLAKFAKSLEPAEENIENELDKGLMISTISGIDAGDKINESLSSLSDELINQSSPAPFQATDNLVSVIAALELSTSSPGSQIEDAHIPFSPKTFRASVESIENARILTGSAIEDYPRISPSLLKQILTNMKQSDSSWKINNQPNLESSLPSKSSNYYKMNTDQPGKESFKDRKLPVHVTTKVEQKTKTDPNESGESEPADQEQLIHLENATNTPETYQSKINNIPNNPQKNYTKSKPANVDLEEKIKESVANRLRRKNKVKNIKNKTSLLTNLEPDKDETSPQLTTTKSMINETQTQSKPSEERSQDYQDDAIYNLVSQNITAEGGLQQEDMLPENSSRVKEESYLAAEMKVLKQGMNFIMKQVASLGTMIYTNIHEINQMLKNNIESALQSGERRRDLYVIEAQNNHSGFEAKFHEYKNNETGSKENEDPRKPWNKAATSLDIIQKDGAVTHLRKGEIKADKRENITIVTKDQLNKFVN